MNLRQLAKGEACKFRIPDICNGNWDTTVLCHIRERFYGGGIKPLDVIAVHGCSSCHDEFDGRTHKSELTRAQLDQIGLGALCEQLIWYAQNQCFNKSMNTAPSKILPRRVA